MKIKYFPASGRGRAQWGWLDSHHSFSFGQWHDPEKVHFGALRVLNDDVVQGGGGFPTHPHDNMEIISIPLVGSLVHKDSTGTDGTIRTGDVQIMSAGTGIRHSEYNASKTDPVNFLQIWIFPKQENIKPHYDQKTFERKDRLNRWQIVVSPDQSGDAVWINQNARLALADLQSGQSIGYAPAFAGNGTYLFVLSGEVDAGGQQLDKRDAIGIWEADQFSIKAIRDAELLAIEIPMNLA